MYNKNLIVFLLIISTVFTVAAQTGGGDDRGRIHSLLENEGVQIYDDANQKYDDFQLVDISGKQVRLSDFEGKVIILNFWATWCGPCRMEMPSMEALYSEYKGSGLAIVAVNMGDERDTVYSFIKENKYTFPVLLDKTSEIGGKYGANAIPLSFIFDREGFVVAGVNGTIEWDTEGMRESIELLLNEGTQNSPSPDIETDEDENQETPGEGRSSRPDSAVSWADGDIFFTRGNELLLYDYEEDAAVEGFPRPLGQGAWPAIGFDTVDAVVDYGDGKVLFFSGDQYISFDKHGNKIDAGYPRRISGSLTGVTFDSIDAAVNNGKGKAYFFKGDEYIRYDLDSRRADSGYPKPINNYTWPGLPFRHIDAVMNWADDKFFFFSGEEYVRFDIEEDEADTGYPKTSSEYWNGMEFGE